MSISTCPPICLIVPVCDGALYLRPVLESIARQTVVGALRCIIVVNGSTDESLAIAEDAIARRMFAGQVVCLNERSIPLALNAALPFVRADEIVVRLDAHTIYEPDYCERIAEAFGALPPDVWCVGGQQRPAEPNDFGQKLVRSLMTNPLGLGGAAFRTDDTSRQVAGVYLGAWRPGVLQRLGGYDVRWKANEDAELSERLRAAGGRTWLVPAKSEYLITRSPAATIRQWGKYGYWRAKTMRVYPRSVRVRHVVPPLALLFALVCCISPARWLLIPGAALYALAIASKRQPGDSALLTIASIPFFASAHAAFASGILIGFPTWTIRGMLAGRRRDATTAFATELRGQRMDTSEGAVPVTAGGDA